MAKRKRRAAHTIRVALDARSLSCRVPRGWDRYALGLIRGLVHRGVEVTLLHRERIPLYGPHVDGLGCRVLGVRDRGGLYWEQVALPRVLWGERFDLYHAPFEHGVPLAAPCPVVLTIHSATHASYLDLIQRGLLEGPEQRYLGSDARAHNFWQLYMQAQVWRADHILTTSEFSRDEILRLLGMPEDRVTTTPLAVDEVFHRPARPKIVRAATRARLGVGRPYILCVGGYEPHKNMAGLLEAFALARAVRPDLSLVLVGTKAVPDSLRRRAEELGLHVGRDLVFLVDVVEDLVDLYDDAALFASLSWRESFGLPALEALTRGIPVVVSGWGAAPEVVGAAGRLVDPRDAIAARDAILEQLECDRAAQSWAAAEQSGKFHWERTVGRTVEVYGRLVGDRRGVLNYPEVEMKPAAY